MIAYDDRFEKTGIQSVLKTWGKVCYFIMGNAGSGTRLVTNIIGSVDGVLHNPGRLNGRIDMNDWRGENADKVVIKRDGGYQPTPHLDKISANIRKGRRIFWIFTIRRPSRYEIYGKPQKMPEYMRAVESDDLWIIWDNSLMFLDPQNFLKEMGRVLLLDFPKDLYKIVRNEDEKWLHDFGIT